MRITREEAKKHIVTWFYSLDDYELPPLQVTQALQVAIDALRPVRREQVERVLGKWITVHDTSDREWSKCGSCQAELDGLEDAYNFCPHCGAPMTDEAVDIIMRRLEALQYGKAD